MNTDRLKLTINVLAWAMVGVIAIAVTAAGILWTILGWSEFKHIVPWFGLSTVALVWIFLAAIFRLSAVYRHRLGVQNLNE